MNVMLAGDRGYFRLLKANCKQIRKIYPHARIIIYDYGLTASQQAEFKQQAQAEIIDWRAQLNDISLFQQRTSPEQIHALALAFNARNTGIIKRLRKAVLKRFPHSAFSKQYQIKALRFEHLLLQKIKCMQDAAERFIGEPFVFLDADALPFEPFDEIFESDADITVTLLTENLSWKFNRCVVLNSGVIFFGPRDDTRREFLQGWWNRALVTDEWLREQTALVRFIADHAPKAFVANTTSTINLETGPIRLRMVPCDRYNFFAMENIALEDFPMAKIYHFTGRRQEPALFNKIMAFLSARHPAS